MKTVKKKIIIIACAVIVLALFLIKFAGLRVLPKTSEVRDYLTTVEEYEVTSIFDLHQGDVYEQTITGTREEIAGFNIKFGTYAVTVQGKLQISFEDIDGNTSYYNEILDCQTIKDNEYKLFLLNNVITDGYGKNYKIRIEVIKLEENQRLALFASETDSYGEGVCFKNGQEITNLDVICQLSGTSGYLYTWYFIAVIIIVVGFLLLCCFGFVRGSKIEYLYLIIGLIFGTIFIMCFPPYTAPDEQRHIATTYAHASKLLGQDPIFTEDGTVIYRGTDAEIVLDTTVSQNHFDNIYEALKYSEHDLNRNSSYGELLNVPFWVYTPQILGVALGMLLQLSGFWTIYLGKFFAMLFFTGCAFLAIKVIPWGKKIILTVALLPITLELAVSYSYDNVIIALCLLCISYIMYLIYSKSRINWKDYLFVAVLICLIAPGKMFYFLIGGMMFLIPRWKYKNSKYYWIINSGIVVLGVLTLLIFRFQYMSDYVGTDGTESLLDPSMMNYTIKDILGNIPHSINVLLNTFLDKSDFYLNSMLGSSLGWLQLNISDSVIIGFAVVLFGVSICGSREEIVRYSVDNKFRLINWGLCGLMFMGILAALWISWTPNSYSCIEGVQGRYFLPFLPMFLFTFKNKVVVLQREIDQWIGVAVFILLTFTFISIVPYVLA